MDANSNTWNNITDGTTASANIQLLNSENSSSGYAQSTNVIVSDLIVHLSSSSVLSSEATISGESSSALNESSTIYESSNESVSSEVHASSGDAPSSSSSKDDEVTGLFECNGTGQLTFFDAFSDQQVSLYSIHGKLMFTRSLTGTQMVIEPSALPMGVYYVAIKTAQGIQVDILNYR